MTTPTKITTIAQLAAAISAGHHGFFIHGGLLRSSKHIAYDGDRFSVFNDIDGTTLELTAAQLATHSNIGTAIECGNFYQD